MDAAVSVDQNTLGAPRNRPARTISTTSSTDASAQICRYFRHGQCKFGANCFFSHDLSSQSSQPSSQTSTICRYFLEGNCRFGSKCFYAHVLPSSDNNQRATNATNAATSQSSASTTKQVAPVETTTKNEASSETKRSTVVRMLNKPKLVTTSFFTDTETSANTVNASESTAESTATSYFEALTGLKKREAALNDDEEAPDMFDPSYLEYLKRQREAFQTGQEVDATGLCPYFEKSLACPFGDECVYIHGDLCDICNMPCLHPFDERQRDEHRADCMKEMERDMEEAFATQCSADKVCGICMETVWGKENQKISDQRFGILENCNHIFCLPCIRKWRASKSYENKIVKACPECRVKSDYVTPSRYWFENEEQKRKIIDGYKASLGNTPCKYFKQGDGECPFGNKCFYLHLNKDGSKAVLPEPIKRHRINQNGIREAFTNLFDIDFDIYDYDGDEDDEDSVDLLEFFRLNIFDSDWSYESLDLERIRSFFED